MSRTDRLQKWVNTLSTQQMEDLLVECVDHLIDSEMISFWDDTKTPYWDGNGENIDGTDRVDEDEEVEEHKEDPKTLDEAVAYILPSFEGMEDTKEFKKGEDYFASYCHSQLSGGIGMQIRNTFGLWDENSVLHKHFKTFGIDEPDSMSDKIVREVYKKMI